MPKKTIFFSILLAVFSLAVFAGSVPTVSADETLDGLNKTAGKVTAFSSQINDSNSNFIQTKAGQIIGTALSLVGVIFLILMIYAGIMWMTASGNDQKVTKAKDLLINSIIGLIIIFAAYAITNFVGTFIGNLTQ